MYECEHVSEDVHSDEVFPETSLEPSAVYVYMHKSEGVVLPGLVIQTSVTLWAQNMILAT